MANAASPGQGTLVDPYGEGYFGRVYRTSLIVFAIAAALVTGRGGWAGLIGLTYGAAISLGSLWAIEKVVRAVFRPEIRLNPRWMAGLMVLKLPLLAMALSGAAWLAVHHLADPFALVGGVALPQAVIFLKAVGSLVVSALPAPAVPVPQPRAQHGRARDAERRGAAGLPAPELSPLN